MNGSYKLPTTSKLYINMILYRILSMTLNDFGKDNQYSTMTFKEHVYKDSTPREKNRVQIWPSLVKHFLSTCWFFLFGTDIDRRPNYKAIVWCICCVHQRFIYHRNTERVSLVYLLLTLTNISNMIESICKDWTLSKYKDLIASSSVWVSKVRLYENSTVTKTIRNIDYL